MASNTTTTSPRSRAPLAATLILAAGLAMVGCEMDSFVDPSVVGRWEHTPTIVPILDRIDSIESDTGEFVEISQVRPEDLQVEAMAYRIGAGDVIQAQISSLDQEGARTGLELLVDPTGAVNIPQIGRVSILGLTAEEAERAIARAMIQAGIVGEDFGRNVSPVLIQVVAARQQTYSIFGAVRVPSRFQIPYPDYRLLEALTDAGGISPSLKYVYVIRQVPLGEADDDFVGTPPPTRPSPRPTRPTTPPSEDEDILDLIERLTDPDNSPGALGGSPAIGLSALGSGGSGSGQVRFIETNSPPPALAMADQNGNGGPAIDLIDDDRSLPSGSPTGPIRVDLPGDGPTTPIAAADGAAEWRFVDGRWRKVLRHTASPEPANGLPEGEDPLATRPGEPGLMTQRVIQVPVAPLLQGAPQYNIVIRPQDVISVPPPPAGLVYMGGQVARPGVFNLDPLSELTLKRSMVAAGGLNAIGIPERVDLIRRVGEGRQAVVRLNARAIWEGTQPDIMLKPDDVLNFGTNFWATPLAVIRGGFRASYGFGFLLDRNFGNDVFGAPPTNINR